jgi:endonuclease/exonuclease/phosphatase family metal-dependent hydrolase
MRIVTYNIRGWRTLDGEPNLHQLIAALQTIGGDVVGLNEVFYPRAVAGESRPALAMLAEALGMHYVFGPCLRWPAQDDMPATAYGNAILSRWPVIASAAHHLTSKEEDPQGLLLQREQRGLLEARILLPGGQTFTVYQTHLDHHGETTRAIQLRIARTWLVRDRNRPHLVMGDFNTVSPWDFAADPQALAQVTAVDHGPRLCAVGPHLSALAAAAARRLHLRQPDAGAPRHRLRHLPTASPTTRRWPRARCARARSTSMSARSTSSGRGGCCAAPSRPTNFPA